MLNRLKITAFALYLFFYTVSIIGMLFGDFYFLAFFLIDWVYWLFNGKLFIVVVCETISNNLAKE